MMELVSVGKDRQSNFELLRIIAIFLIVVSHACVHTPFLLETGTSFNFNFALKDCLTLGSMGVNVFVLISGYFLIQSRFKLSRVIKILISTGLYSLAIYLSFLISKQIVFQAPDLVAVFFPVIYQEWWFLTAYILLYIFSPLLNTLLTHISKKLYQIYLLVIFIIWSIIGIIFSQTLYLNGLLWFFYMYSVGAYIRLYPETADKIKRPWLWFTVVVIAYFALIIGIDLINHYAHTKMAALVMTTKPALAFPVALFLFLTFRKMEIGHRPVINLISSTTLGIYALHEHPLMRKYIWSLFPSVQLNVIGQWYFIFYIVGIAACVFIVTGLIDLVRQYISEVPFRKLYQKLDTKLSNWYLNYTSK